MSNNTNLNHEEWQLLKVYAACDNFITFEYEKYPLKSSFLENTKKQAMKLRDDIKNVLQSKFSTEVEKVDSEDKFINPNATYQTKLLCAKPEHYWKEREILANNNGIVLLREQVNI